MWYNVVERSIVQFGWYCTVRHGMMGFGMVWYSVLYFGTVRVYCNLVWCGPSITVLCGAVWWYTEFGHLCYIVEKKTFP